MAFVPKPNSGALFQNDKKEKETHPDLKGDFNIDGVNYWISGWKKTSARGEFISFAVEKKQAPGLSKTVDDKPAHRPAVQQSADDTFFDDSLPF